MHSWWGPAGQQVAPAWTRVHQWGWGAPGLAPFCWSPALRFPLSGAGGPCGPPPWRSTPGRPDHEAWRRAGLSRPESGSGDLQTRA